MRYIAFILVFLLMSSMNTHAQHTLGGSDKRLSKFASKWSPKAKKIEVWIIQSDGYVNHGLLYAVHDSAISLITPGDLKKGQTNHSYASKVTDINKIILREQHRKRKYLKFSIGAGLIGAVVGYMSITEAEWSYSSSIFKPAFGMAAGFFPLMILGAWKISIPIKGKKENYRASKDRLRSISVVR